MTIGDEFYLDETQHNVSTGKVSEKSTYLFMPPLLFLVVLLPHTGTTLNLRKNMERPREQTDQRTSLLIQDGR
jgi:hypothetical protein